MHNAEDLEDTLDKYNPKTFFFYWNFFIFFQFIALAIPFISDNNTSACCFHIMCNEGTFSAQWYLKEENMYSGGYTMI